MPTFNRLEYLTLCLESLKNTIKPNNIFVNFHIIDDASNEDTKKFINNYDITCFDKFNKHLLEIKSEGVCELNLLKCWDINHKENYDYYCVLDSDTLVNKNWLIKLCDLHNNYSHSYNHLIVSAFDTKNHPTHKKLINCVEKKSIGGVNMFFNKKTYEEIVRPCLNVSSVSWDWQVVNKIQNTKGCLFLVTTPSYIDHIGKISTARDSNIYTFFDQAKNFIGQ